MSGLLIVFDGPDGVGKSTQLNLVQKKLTEAGHQVTSLRNPGGTPIGEALREIFLSSTERPPLSDLYMSAAIQESLIDAVSTLREQGQVVLMDRGPLSIAAYQIYGSGIPAEIGWQQVDSGQSRLQPALTILYTADLNTSLSRARQASSSPDYFESKPDDFFERVAQGYIEATQRYPVTRIDANRSIESIHADTMHAIEALLTT